MLHESPLLNAIVENPDDLSLRLKFAEELTNAGNPIGEAIQLQCEQSELTEVDSEWYWRTYKLANLLKGANPFGFLLSGDSLESQWTADLDAIQVNGKNVGKGTLARGFVESYSVFDVANFADCETEVLSVAPLINRFEFSELTTDDQWQQFCRLESTKSAKSIKFEKCRFTSKQLEEVFATQNLLAVQEIVFAQCHFESIEELGAQPVTTNLKRLEIVGADEARESTQQGKNYLCNLFGSESDCFPSLTSLHLDRCCSEGDLAQLAEWSEVAKLEDLYLGSSKWGADSWTDFLSSNLQSLRKLTIASVKERPTQVDVSKCPNLTEFKIVGGNLGVSAMESLAESLPAGIAYLGLGYCMLDTDALISFLERASLPNTRFLDLHSNELDSSALGKITETDWLQNLTTLKLSFNKLGSQAGVLLGQSELIKNLTFLGLSDASLGDEGASAIFNATTSQLQWLNLDTNNITEQSLAPLLKSEYLDNLVALRLNGNKILESNQEALAERFGSEAIESYWLGYLI